MLGERAQAHEGMIPSESENNHAFVAGYATAVLEREFTVRAPCVHVREGTEKVAWF